MESVKSLIQKGMFAAILVLGFFSANEAGWAGQDQGKGPVVVPVIIRNNRFETSILTVPKGMPVLFRVTNKDNSMEEFESYDMAFEVIVHPHQTIEVPVSGMGAGTYEYFGDFHPRTAHGKIVVQ
jgi:plastocyanin